jgi:proteic killer suppression protein
LPGFGLHGLRGDRKGTWAVVVNKNWRITFRFEGGNAYDVDFEDYH